MDDCAGIDRNKIIERSIEKRLCTKDQAETYSDQQAFQLIMESGFSTTSEFSEISSRGVGLDVVKNTIESLGGIITIDSTLGIGSTFSIKLPLTLTIISVLLAESGPER